MLQRIIVAASTIIFFININSFPLRNWDEAWYGEIIKNMAAGTSPLVPYWNGQYFFDKPPLYFWLSLPIVKIFGLGEWQIRFISSLAGVGSTLLVFLTGKTLFSSSAGLGGSIVFLTVGQVIVRFSHGNLDSLMIFLFLASFYSYLQSGKSKKYKFLTGIFLGLGLLVKGWLLGLFPLILIALWAFFVEKNIPRNALLAGLTALGVSVWYFILGGIVFGKEFIDWYIFNPAASNLASPFQSFNLEFFSFLLRDFALWLLPLIYVVLSKRVILKEIKLFPLVATSLFFIFSISFAREKSDWHILPAYPFLAIVTGFALSKLSIKRDNLIPQKLNYLFLASIILLQAVIVYKIEYLYPDRSMIGAQLGLAVKKHVNSDTILVLDDRDFTSFLYYADSKKVYVITPEGGKEWEWWWMSYQDFGEFLKNKKEVLLVTKNLHQLDIKSKKARVNEVVNGYSLVSLY